MMPERNVEQPENLWACGVNKILNTMHSNHLLLADGQEGTSGLIVAGKKIRPGPNSQTKPVTSDNNKLTTIRQEEKMTCCPKKAAGAQPEVDTGLVQGLLHRYEAAWHVEHISGFPVATAKRRQGEVVGDLLLGHLQELLDGDGDGLGPAF